MDFYIDIKILPDPEFKSSMLMGALFNKLHRILVALEANNIAVSFPDYQAKSLGTILRIHGGKNVLDELMRSSWLKGMSDHILKTEISEIPDQVGYVSVRRRQNKYGNIDKLRSRYVKRHGVSENEAIEAYPVTLEKPLNLPFVNIRSSSTGQPTFPFYVEQKEVDTQILNVDFNKYGISKTATVPWF